MLDLHTQVRQLSRPALLVRAARFAVDDYRRGRDLSRLLDGRVPATPGPALVDLLDIEKEMDAARSAGSHAYQVGPHIIALAAIMSEARDLAATRPLIVPDPT
ncbi:DUF6477 family protein [Loktanella sp. SALINAS62]|uniref:DUF6477 family protein n=1 Tax=Loktanella sp. SALINAS62 TaxID=2706124 RepID=UPI001B8B7719|nr:DUF6477 family protein [Loktanella sp. SALINAS62]MBS1303633.1 hypothetical protein [Loktanella sp. SALINAS62]